MVTVRWKLGNLNPPPPCCQTCRQNSEWGWQQLPTVRRASVGLRQIEGIGERRGGPGAESLTVEGPLRRACHRAISWRFLFYLSLHHFHWEILEQIEKCAQFYDMGNFREFLLISRVKAEWDTYVSIHWNLIDLWVFFFAIFSPFLIYDLQCCLHIIFITVLCYNSSFIPSMFFLFLQILISLVWIFNWNQNWMLGSLYLLLYHVIS